ncbi:MAG TPA: hypothetical protein VGH40_15770 [Roseiarcus sp.]|jgi:hypothetical protein
MGAIVAGCAGFVGGGLIGAALGAIVGELTGAIALARFAGRSPSAPASN